MVNARRLIAGIGRRSAGKPRATERADEGPVVLSAPVVERYQRWIDVASQPGWSAGPIYGPETEADLGPHVFRW